MVDTEVVKHDYDASTPALVLQPIEELLEVQRVVVLTDDNRVDEAPLLTYGAYHSYGRTPFLDHAELHARGEPALGQLHLQVHCGLIKVEHSSYALS